MAHFYTWSATVYRALCEALVPTPECRGHLRRCAPNKGLRPLRRFAAIPPPLAELNTEYCSKDRFAFMSKAAFFVS